MVPGHLEAGPGLGTRDDLQRETAIVVLLHGFNVNYKDGSKSLLKLTTLLPSAKNSAVIAVLWPGDHWSGPLSYSFEGRDADDTASELVRYLGDVTRPDASVAFVAHSLGCRVAMETAARLIAAGRDPQQICLLAAAIDDYSLASTEAYLAATNGSARVAVLSSKKDNVLRFAYPAGDLFQAFIFADDFAGLALGYHGPRPHKASGSPVPKNVLDKRIPKSRRPPVGHSDYLPGTKSVSDEQRAAAKFADAVLAGDDHPVYG